MSDLITIGAACRLIGGDEKPIHPATYYRGVAAGRYPAPVRVSPNVARISKTELLAAIERLMEAPYAPRAA
jgi:hypothetical protein